MNLSQEEKAIKVTEVTHTFRETIKEVDLPLLQKGGMVLVLFFLGAVATGLILKRLCRFFFKEKVASILWSKLAKTSICMGGFVMVHFGLYHGNLFEELPETVLVNYFLQTLITFSYFCSLLWVLSIFDAIFGIIHQRLENAGKPIPVAFFFYGRVFKTLLITLFIIAIIPFLFAGSRGFDRMISYIGLSTISAGAIAGLAFQPVIKDILGGMFIISQNLFTEGDWIEFSAGRRLMSGRVLDVDIRYTKLRRFTGSIVMVANNAFLTSIVDNYGRCHYAYYALPLSANQKDNKKIEHFLDEYQKLIQHTPHIESEKCHATVKNLEVNKMELDLHIFFKKSDDQTKILRIHSFWQEIITLAKKNKLPL
ncbi:MAG: mechanosensitive ion channel domain-containing protein [Bacteroidota bacterium]